MVATGDDLILAAYTVDHASLVERVTAAQQFGFSGISLRTADLRRALDEGWTFVDMRQLVVDHGLVVTELEALTGWALDDPTASPDDHQRAELLWAAAEVLEARAVMLADLHRGPRPLEQLALGFASICRRAASFGMLALLEPLGGSAVPHVGRAGEVVHAAGEPNGGVLFDTWHHFRAGGTLEHLTEIAHMIGSVQINDAPAEPTHDMFTETMHHRLLPGEGDADVVGTLRHLRHLDVRVPITVEVMSDRLRALPPLEAAGLAAAAARAVVVEASPR